MLNERENAIVEDEATQVQQPLSLPVATEEVVTSAQASEIPRGEARDEELLFYCVAQPCVENRAAPSVDRDPAAHREEPVGDVLGCRNQFRERASWTMRIFLV